MKKGLLITVMLMFVVVALGCATEEAATKSGSVNYWDKKKGDCEQVLSMPHAYPLSQISYCTKMWEMYRYVDDIPLKERSMYAVAFSQVSYDAPDAYDRAVADAALARICIPRHPRSGDGSVHEEIPDSLECSQISQMSIGGKSYSSTNPFAQIRGTVEVEEPSASDAKAANAAYKKATKTRKTSPSKSIAQYKEALSHDPYNVAAKYDLACAQAVVGDEREALKTLEELYTWDDPEVDRKLVKARSDEDFESLRANPNFKLLTGYVSIALINGAGSIGEPTVAAMKKKLEQKNFTIETVGKSNRPELVPQIWYREGFESYANKIKEIIGNRKTSVKVMSKPTSDNDILVVWGQPEAATLGAGQSAPVVQGKRAEGSDNKLDDLLKEVDSTQQSIDHAQQAGEKLTNVGSGW